MTFPANDQYRRIGNNTAPDASRGNGNIANDGTRLYQYDALNRLIQVSKTPATPVVIATYVYDALGRRIQKTVSNGGLSGDIPDATTDYYYDADQCVEERNDDADSVIRQFVWGQYIDELTQLKTYVTTGGGSLAAGTYYPLQDLLYRTTALTNSSGAIVEAYDTDAYGNTLIFTAAGTGGNWWADNATQGDRPACEYIFTGRQYDPETGIYFYRARYYHPMLGRFISRDPAGYVDGASLYEIDDSRPITFLDWQGTKTDKYGTYWDPNVDWLNSPYRKPNGFIPGMGFPPGDPNYNTQPDLRKEYQEKCKIAPNNKPCNQCWADFNNARSRIFGGLGNGRLGSGVASGAGWGFLVGVGVKGGTWAVGEWAGSAILGPIGWVAAGGAVVGGAGIGWYEGSWREQFLHDQIEEINDALNRCLADCTGGKA